MIQYTHPGVQKNVSCMYHSLYLSLSTHTCMERNLSSFSSDRSRTERTERCVLGGMLKDGEKKGKSPKEEEEKERKERKREKTAEVYIHRREKTTEVYIHRRKKTSA